MVATNSGSIVELGHSSDGHFEQLFVAHSVSIQGFAMGCWPIIAIDSAHMIIIISDGHPALLRSVPEVFGLENHAYCYRHLKENFSSFLSKHNTRGNKGSMLVKHKEESNNWKGCIRLKIEEKVQQKIAKGEVYAVTPFMNGIFGVSIGTTFLNVDIMKRTCTCRGWEMLGIPCEHAAAVILSIGQNVVDFVQDWYKFPMQKLIYLGSFSDIETHDMPMVVNDGLVRSTIGEVFLSLNPPHTKRPPDRLRKKCIESQFQDKRTVSCSRCHTSGHNRKTCKNPLS
ncbi:hypothetical protein AAG906_012174 [Vitis piasezkii]